MTSITASKSCPPDSAAAQTRWPLERVLFAMAGTVVLIASLLTLLVSPWFVLLAAFAGVNQWLFVVFGDCLASVVLTRLFGLRRGIER